MKYRVLALCLFVFAGSLSAHDDVDDQLQRVTSDIALSPNDPELYLKRGELFRVRGQWQRAQKDYDHAIQLKPDFAPPFLCHAIVSLNLKDPAGAKKWVDKFLELQGAHPKGFLIRARANSELQHVEAAAKDYDASLSMNPDVDIFAERSQFLVAQGRIQEALDSLDEAISALGPIVTLQTLALDLEMKQKNYKSALERVTSILNQAERKERWLVRRAEILVASGNLDAARQSYSEAFLALQQLPENRRSTPAMQELEKQIHSGLTNTEQ